MSDFEQERVEAVALAEITEAGALEPTIQGVMSLRPGMKLYAHPPADDARVAELEAQLAASDRHGVYLEELTDAQVDRIAALESQLAASREREGRMREAVSEAVQLLDALFGDDDLQVQVLKAALAADKEGE